MYANQIESMIEDIGVTGVLALLAKITADNPDMGMDFTEALAFVVSCAEGCTSDHADA